MAGNIVDFDIWDQAVLTDVIQKPLERASEVGSFLGEQIAPMQDHTEMQAKLRVADVAAFGKGQFRSPDATPALFKPAVSWEERIIGLALLDEMEMISEEEFRKLNSPDENVRRSQGLELESRGRILRLRNERATEWMRWQAFAGNLLITYPTGDKLVIDYGLPAGHKPVTSVLWSDVVNADPIADVQTWSELLATDSGFYGTKLHMSNKTWDYLIRSTKIKDLLTFNVGNIKRPSRADIEELFTSFAAAVTPVIYDGGYRDVGQTGEGINAKTRYLPEGYVLLTTEYVLDGERIAETLDGPVTVSTGYNQVDIRQGTQAEVMLDHMSKTHFFRVASARIPRIKVPEAFLWAKVA